MCSRRINSFFSTCGARRVTLVINPVMSHEINLDIETQHVNRINFTN